MLACVALRAHLHQELARDRRLECIVMRLISLRVVPLLYASLVRVATFDVVKLVRMAAGIFVNIDSVAVPPVITRIILLGRTGIYGVSGGRPWERWLLRSLERLHLIHEVFIVDQELVKYRILPIRVELLESQLF